MKLSRNQFLGRSGKFHGKFKNFATKVFNSTWINVFLPSFTEIGKVGA